VSPWAYFGVLCPVCSVIRPKSSNSSSIAYTVNEDSSLLWTMIRRGILICCQRRPMSSSIPSKAQNVAMPRVIITNVYWQQLVYTTVLTTQCHAETVGGGPYTAQPTASARLPVLQAGGHSSLSNGWYTYRRTGRCAGCDTDALAGRGETWRWMSAAAAASGDRVLASFF